MSEYIVYLEFKSIEYSFARSGKNKRGQMSWYESFHFLENRILQELRIIQSRTRTSDLFQNITCRERTTICRICMRYMYLECTRIDSKICRLCTWNCSMNFKRIFIRPRRKYSRFCVLFKGIYLRIILFFINWCLFRLWIFLISIGKYVCTLRKCSPIQSYEVVKVHLLMQFRL